MSIIRLGSVDSTNRYCEALDLSQVEDFTCYWALEQTAGIGQRGNSWASAPGENLTFSLVLHPTWLPAARQFKLTQMMSLGVLDFLNDIKGFKDPNGINAIVKWPNDIYARMSNTTEGSECHTYGKICGMLVSNKIVGDSMATAICGIGFNVNQREFPEWVPHPTSLSLLTDKQFELEPTLTKLLDCIERRYAELKDGKNLEPEYLSHLMNMGTAARYRHNGQELTATITGVDQHGRLLLTTEEGERLCCAMKEIEMIF